MNVKLIKPHLLVCGLLVNFNAWGKVETMSAIGQRALECGAKKITLLPFNPATPGKYSWVRKKLALENRTCQSGEETALLERALEKKGLVVVPV